MWMAVLSIGCDPLLLLIKGVRAKPDEIAVAFSVDRSRNLSPGTAPPSLLKVVRPP